MKNNILWEKILIIVAAFTLTLCLGICKLSFSPNGSTNLKYVNAETVSQENDFTYTNDGTNATITGVTPEVKILTGVDLIIPSVVNGYTVTSIGASAFTNWTGLTSITIPESVTTIGSQAFYGTTYLATINYNAASIADLTSSSNVFYNAGKNSTGITLNIGANVTKIPAYMFYVSSTSYAPKITLVNFAEENVLTSIGSYAFYNCTNLKSLTISSKVTSIGSYAFYNCTGLTDINFNATSMADLSGDTYTFAYAGNSGTGITVNIGANVTKIPANLLCPYYGSTSYSPKILTVNFEEGSICSSIGSRAFQECYRMTSINIPSSVTSIGTYAFVRCYGLTSLTIPSSITNIGTYAFQSCYGLTSLTIPSSVAIINSYAFENCYRLTSLTIPTSVTTIGSYAFQNCYGLTSLTIPSSVTTINSYAFHNCYSLTSIHIPSGVTSIGANAFSSCYGVTSITADNANTAYKSEDNCLIQKSNNSLVLGCKTSVIPNSVTSIGGYAFAYCTGLTNITIPGNVTSIGTYAFQNCTSLANIMLPDSITTISDYAFYNCTSLNNVTIPFKVTTISSNLFGYCTSLTNITIPSGVTSIGSYAFRNCTGLTNITIPESVTIINTYAFYSCTSLVNITIPSRVTSISNYAFYGCTNLTNISIPDNLTSIGSYAFYGCNKLITIRIPNMVTTIGTQAFYNCTSLTSIAIPASVTSIASNAFYNCTNLTIYTEVAEDAQPSGWVSGWNPSNRPIVWDFSTEITLTLNYNYTDTENDTQTVEFNAIYALGVPVRNYYTFIGWFSEADGGIQYTGGNGVGFAIWSEPASRTIYAKWEWTPVYYDITNSTVETDTGTILSGSATFEVFNGEGVQTDTITLNQEGYLSAYFHTNYTTETFTAWKVKRNDSNTFDSLGSGVSATGTSGRDADQRLDLYSNGVYLVNEEFLDKYLQSNGAIIFKAVYTNSTPQIVTIETDDKTYGTIQVDGIAMLFDQDGKIVNNYAQDYIGDIIIRVIPKNYRAVGTVQTSTDGIDWATINHNGTLNEYTIQVVDGLLIRITYTSLTYTINVVAQTTGDESVSGVAVNNPTGIIGLASLNNVFNTASLNRTLTGYRLVANSTNNIKIFNYLTGRYEYFSAVNGNINLSVNEAFLDKFLKDGEVTIIAIYVKQYEVLIDILNPELGKVVVTIEEPNGNYYDNPDFSKAYDEGSTVTITAIANNGSSITNTTGINSGEQLYEDMFILTLTDDRAITIAFGAQQYSLHTKAVNMDNEVISSISVSATGTALNLLEYFSIEKGSSIDYEFIGWYAKVGDNYILFDDIDRNLTNIQVNETFTRDYADGYELNIVARFAKICFAEISCTSGGEIKEIEIIEGDEAETENMYKENTILKITFMVDQFYYLDAVDGLYDTETVESDYFVIKVDGYRVISLNFSPEVFAVTSNNNLSKASGKINVLTDQLSLGNKVVVTFDVDSGYEITSWKINGMTIAQINSKYAGASAVKNGNTVAFSVTAGWLNDYGSKLDNAVTTGINSTYLMVMAAALLLIPVLVIGILLALRANKKRKAAYAKAVMIRDQRTKGMNMASIVSQLREGSHNSSEEGN